MAVSPQTVERSKEVVAKYNLEFPVLSDEGNQVARQFGLVFELPEDLRAVYRGIGADLPEFNGDDSWTLPLAARYVIDQEGVIRAADVNADYTVRPDPAETLEQLKAVRAG